jgi:hypothetical protein
MTYRSTKNNFDMRKPSLNFMLTGFRTLLTINKFKIQVTSFRLVLFLIVIMIGCSRIED